MPRAFQAAFTAGELAPALHARVDISRYATGAKTLKNFYVHPQGGASNRPGTAFVNPVKDSTKATVLVRFAFSVDDTYILEFGDQYMRVVRNGGHVLEAAKTITGVTQADPAVVTAVAHGFSNGDHVYISDVAGMTEVNGIPFKVANVTASTFELQDWFGADIDAVAYSAYTSGGTVARIYEVATPYLEADLPTLRVAQSRDVLTIVHPNYAPRELSRTGHTSWSLSTITFAPEIAAPTSVIVTKGAAGSRAYYYRVTAVAEEGGEESLPTSANTTSAAVPTTSAPHVVSWAAVTGAVKYNIYKNDNGVYGYIGSTENLNFSDDNISPDLTDTPPRARNPFSGAGDYPSVATFIQQRRTFANTDDEPATLWMSQIASFGNMSVSEPAKDTDALTFTVVGNELNEVRDVVALQGSAVILTAGAEWSMDGGDAAISASNIPIFRRQAMVGAANIPALPVGANVLFVEDGGEAIQELKFSLESNAFTPDDLSVLSRHLFEAKEVTWIAYAHRPDRLVWVGLDDGTVLSLTYQPRQQIWAWSQHDFGGEVEWGDVVREGNRDVLYMVVKRTIDGGERRYIECLSSRRFEAIADAYFVDCGRSLNAQSPSRTLSAVWWLRGEALTLLADGNVHPTKTAAGNTVTLDYGASTVHVGLGYTCDLETLPIGAVEIQGRKKRIGSMKMKVQATRGVMAGTVWDDLNTFKQDRDWDDPEAPIPPITGTIEVTFSSTWDDDTTVKVRQSDPLPLTILAVLPEVSVGGS